MKLVFILGDAAVGKMTVGQELMKITDLRLFHNHMTIESVIEIFGRYDGKTIAEMRDLIFRNFAASENYGMIFTMMMIGWMMVIMKNIPMTMKMKNLM